MRVGVDIETTGLDPRQAELVLVALSYPGGEVEVFEAADPRLPDRLRRVWSEELVCHFATFDLPWLCRAFSLPVPERVADTWVAEAILTSGLGLSLSLEETVARRLGKYLDKSLQTSFQAGESVTEEQRAYAAEDARVLLELLPAQEALLRSLRLWRVWELERLCTPIFVRMALEGVPFQVDRVEPFLEEVERQRAYLAKELGWELGGPYLSAKLASFEEELAALRAWEAARKAVQEAADREWEVAMAPALSLFTGRNRAEAEARAPADWPEEWRCLLRQEGEVKGRRRYRRDRVREWERANPKPPRPKPPAPFNLDSPEQVLEALQLLGYRDLDSVAEEKLRLYPFRPEHRDLVDRLLLYRSRRKLETAFGDNLVQSVWPDGRLRPTYRQVGTASGRPTASNPNLLQLPAGEAGEGIRGAVAAPPGWKLIVADYSQIELRLLAALSGDEKMVAAFQAGEDLHWVTARLLFGPGAGERERKLAKSCNFLTVYGGGPRRLAEVASQGGIVLSPAEAGEVIRRWREEFPGAWSALEEWQERAKRERSIRSAWGRARFFPQETKADEVARAGANHVIQSTAADLMKLAMVVVDRLVAPLGGTIILQVYDELLVLCPETVAERVALLVEKGMRLAAERFLGPVPAEVGLVIAERWSEKK